MWLGIDFALNLNKTTDIITCTSEGDNLSGRRRQGVNRPNDTPAGRHKGASQVPRLARPARWS